MSIQLYDPLTYRYQGERSWWDTLHPGRHWADNLRAAKKQNEAVEKVEGFFESKVPE